MPNRRLLVASTLAVLLACTAEPRGVGGPDLDAQLVDLLNRANVTPLAPPAIPSQAMVTLGQALMFDKELSGNRDISCATCHHPTLHSTDAIPLSIGQGATGLGPARGMGGVFIPRHAPDLFNRGVPQWQNLFWDGRVAVAPGGFATEAGAALPAGVASVLAAQAMFPVENRDEMRGYTGNELAALPDNDFTGVWNAIMVRLRAIPKYDTLFQAAFGQSVNAVGFEFAANAIAAFQTAAFNRLDTPYDHYVAGDRNALSDTEKRGAILFFGKANCGKCHLGPLLTDQKFHNVAVPQLGPGKPPEAPLDFGHERVTGLAADRFAYRTPPLRNVALTAPYFHDGAFATLEGAVRHYINVTRSLQTYDSLQLPPLLQNSVASSDPTVQAQMLATLDPIVADTLVLSDQEVSEIVAFLQALTDPSAQDLSGEIPATVPSGLPVGD
ncbi:MAG TPA: cytochrome c peroxidase [Gemmatimonadales bacterium]|nr:cytochrome c peroxidase [Gemmatimonadales bacterium]